MVVSRVSDQTVRAVIIGIFVTVNLAMLQLSAIAVVRDGQSLQQAVSTLTTLVTDVLIAAGPVAMHLSTMRAMQEQAQTQAAQNSGTAATGVPGASMPTGTTTTTTVTS